MGTPGYENGVRLSIPPDRLAEPLARKKPMVYFVNSMPTDLFKEAIRSSMGGVAIPAISALAATFNASFPAAAIRYVELSGEPVVLVFNGTDTHKGRRWSSRPRRVPEHLWLGRALDDDSFASDLLNAPTTTKRVGKMPAEAWFESVDHDRYEGPRAGDLGLDQVAHVLVMRLHGGSTGQHLAYLCQQLCSAQLRERVDGTREFQVPVRRFRARPHPHDAGTHHHAELGTAAAATFAHGLGLGLDVQLIDERQPIARLDVGHPVQAQWPLAQLGEPGLLTRREVGAIAAEQVAVDLAQPAAGVDLATDRHASGVFMVAQAQGLNVRGVGRG